MECNEQQFEYTTRQAGQLGGLTTLSRYSIVHYSRIGRKGQASFTAKYTVEVHNSSLTRYNGSMEDVHGLDTTTSSVD